MDYPPAVLEKAQRLEQLLLQVAAGESLAATNATLLKGCSQYLYLLPPRCTLLLNFIFHSFFSLPRLSQHQFCRSQCIHH